MRPINQSLDFQHNDIVNANIVNMIVEARPSDPTTATSGQIYYNSTMKMLRIFDGLVWRTLSSGTGVMSYKGVVTNWTDLPTTGMEKGDYWVNSTTQAARVWNGNTSSWDDIGNATFVVDTILSDTSTNAVENRVITQELLQRLKKLGNEPVSGQPYHFPFNINAIVQESDKISTTFDTLTLDGNNTKTTYPLVIPAADPTNDKAGLLTKALYDAKSAVSVSDTGTATEEVQYITIDGVEKKIAGGEDVLVHVNAIMTDTQSFEGTVTQEQFDACREGGKILSITLSNALGEVVCKAVANEYVSNSETGFHAMALITRDGVTGAVTIGEIKVSSDLILRGTLFSIGANVEWGSIGGTLGNQADLKNALAGKADVTAIENKLDKLPEEPYSHTQYKFPFHIEEPVQNADSISAKFHTLEINNGTERAQYTISLPAADVANNKAGVFTKAIYDEILTHTGGGSWGSITGTLSNQTDLQDALDDKADCTDLTALEGRVTTNEGNITLNTQNIALNTAAIATKQKQITYGTADPSGGEDGDIYIKYIA